MESWKEVKNLRHAGRLDEALRVGSERLRLVPDDFRTRSQLEWVCYDKIKDQVNAIEDSLKTENAPRHADTNRLYGLLREYADLKPGRQAGMALSKILFRIERVGRHFDRFLPFLGWLGLDCLAAEDYNPNQSEDGHEYPSLAYKLARESAAWVKARPEAANEQVIFAVNLAQQVQNKATDPDKTWLEWDLIYLLHRAGDNKDAAKLMVTFLKHKRTESWAWTEAARIHQDEQPDLAVACFCQAFKLGAEPKFVGKVHCELASLLADSGDLAQASREAMIAGEIYDQEGWRYPAELRKLLESDWYDPALPAVEPERFYALHADEALTLCFDEVREYPATYLGMTEARDGKKPKPRFAVRTDKGVVSMLGRRGVRLLTSLAPGSPVKLLIGIEAQRRDVLEAHLRVDGSQWDCMETRDGVVFGYPPGNEIVTVYCGREQELRVPLTVWRDQAKPHPGSGVRVWGAINPVNDRFEVYNAESASMPQNTDIATMKGSLRRHAKGFGFVGDVFVPAPLLATIQQNGQELSVIAVQTFDKSKQQYGWRAIAISPCS